MTIDTKIKSPRDALVEGIEQYDKQLDMVLSAAASDMRDAERAAARNAVLIGSGLLLVAQALLAASDSADSLGLDLASAR